MVTSNELVLAIWSNLRVYDDYGTNAADGPAESERIAARKYHQLLCSLPEARILVEPAAGSMCHPAAGSLSSVVVTREKIPARGAVSCAAA